MKARHRGAGDGDETKREDRAGEDRATAVNEPGERGHAQRRSQQHDGQPEQGDRAKFHERAQVVPRREQEPHGQHRGQETVAHDPPGERRPLEGQRVRQHRAVNPLAPGDRQQQAGETEHAHEPNLSRCQIAQAQSHEHRDRHGRSDGEQAPGTLGQRLHHDEGQHREQDDHDGDNADQGEKARQGPDLLAHHLAKRFASPADRTEQDDGVVHGAAEGRTDEDPQHARKVAELRGQHRSDERTRSGDRREVVSKHDPAVGLNVITAVFMHNGWRRAQLVDGQHPGHQPGTVEAPGDGEHAYGGHHHPERADRLIPRPGKKRDRGGADQHDQRPDQHAGPTGQDQAFHEERRCFAKPRWSRHAGFR